MNNKITIGIVAHVDAGKTTLSEQLLLKTNVIRQAGRVDKGNTYMDTNEVERARGITIFSSQASFVCKDKEFVLIDTPGHADFGAEMERVLSVLDYAVLLISAAEGVQSHTKTLWRLLQKYEIPVFVFINKMDIALKEGHELLKELDNNFGDGFVDFSLEEEERLEEISLCDESVMEDYLCDGTIEDERIAELICAKKLYPVFFGSALRGDGAKELLDGLSLYACHKDYPVEFGARVYKIANDSKGKRLTFLKLVGGELSVRQEISGKYRTEENDKGGEEGWTEKITEIRVYSGEKYENVQKAGASDVVAVTGLSHTRAGMGLGSEKDDIYPTLEAVITYQMFFAGEISPAVAYRDIRLLEEELPELSLEWDEQNRSILVKLMGAVQTEVLETIIHERFGYVVSFGPGRIAYRETISDVVEGVGHFEPLRHYAEVHLLLEPGERGSGMSFRSDCPEDVLARNWQRLVMTHLKEKSHRGVLVGAPVTDMIITIVSGKAHAKHTQGGDFRQATYRAVRQGLKKARGVLLEPYYRFVLEIPGEMTGRAMTDIDAMYGKCEPPDTENGAAILKGVAPVSTMHEYASDVAAYTAGEGRLSLSVAGYYPCHNTQEVMEERGYDSEADLKNPTGSVFCTHGAGFVVPWDEVENYMHMESALKEGGIGEDYVMPVAIPKSARGQRYVGSLEEDKELFEIFEREFGPIKRKSYNRPKEIRAPKPATGKTTEDYILKRSRKPKERKHYFLVDGYNVIHTFPDLKELAADDLAAARGRLIDIVSNYAGYTGVEAIVVYDAYKVPGGTGSINKYSNVYVIYTKEAETADAYIEKATHEIAKEHRITVVTSDSLVQLIVMGAGAVRMSSREFGMELSRIRSEGADII